MPVTVLVELVTVTGVEGADNGVGGADGVDGAQLQKPKPSGALVRLVRIRRKSSTEHGSADTANKARLTE